MGLVLENVKKTFAGKLVVDQLSLTMEKPGVYGLLGTNGAGKTTTIRMILGILKKDSGTISWNGKPVERKNVNFGYLPEERGIYPKTKVRDQLVYFAQLKGMNGKEAKEQIEKWAEKLKVSEYLEMPAEKLSKGNQQKVQFITAILHDPELIVLDEPFSGLDPVNTELLKNVIIELVKDKKYIIMSSHQMTSIEEFCTEVILLNRGKTVLKGKLTEIKNSYQANEVEIYTDVPIDDFLKEEQLSVYENKDCQYKIKIENQEEGYAIFDNLKKQDIRVIKFEIKKPSLHEIFIEKVGG